MSDRSDGAVVVVTWCHARTPPQLPLTHTTPIAHCGLPPHWQPLLEQLSARDASHEAQEPPAVPHWPTVPGLRQVVLLLQHPLHEVESQTHALFKQCVPAPHAGPVPQRHDPLPQLLAVVRLHEVHCAPPVPHSLAVGAPTQL